MSSSRRLPQVPAATATTTIPATASAVATKTAAALYASSEASGGAADVLPPHELKRAIEVYLGVTVQDEDFGISLPVVTLFELLLQTLRGFNSESLLSICGDAPLDTFAAENAATLPQRFTNPLGISFFEHSVRIALADLNITYFCLGDLISPEPLRIRRIVGTALAFIQNNYFVCDLIEKLEEAANSRMLENLRLEETIDENERTVAEYRQRHADEAQRAAAVEAENKRFATRVPSHERQMQANADAAAHAARLSEELREGLKGSISTGNKLTAELAGLRKLIVDDPSELIEEINRMRRHLERVRTEESEVQSRIGTNFAKIREEAAAFKILTENTETALEMKPLREKVLLSDTELQDTSRRCEELQMALKRAEKDFEDLCTVSQGKNLKLTEFQERRTTLVQSNERQISENRAERDLVNRESEDAHRRCESRNAEVKKMNMESKELHLATMSKINEKKRETDELYRSIKKVFENELQAFKK